MSARLLLIEDEPALLAVLEAAMAFGGFESARATRGDEALRLLAKETFDAVLLDMGLPDTDGSELLPKVREITEAPIIVVSGRGTEQDKIAALDLGADDYVAKPFLPGELLARIRAALRRYGVAGQDASGRQPLRVGELVIDPLDRSVRLRDASVQLNRAEFQVLRRLAAAPGAVLSRADLMAVLYGSDEDMPEDSRIVDVYVSRIRAKLRTLPGAGDPISSARGVGWSLDLPASQGPRNQAGAVGR